MPRHKPTHQGEPTHLVLDNEALEQISDGRLGRPLLTALEAVSATAGRVLVPTSVFVERNFDPVAGVCADRAVARWTGQSG